MKRSNFKDYTIFPEEFTFFGAVRKVSGVHFILILCSLYGQSFTNFSSQIYTFQQSQMLSESRSGSSGLFILQHCITKMYKRLWANEAK